MNNSLILIGYSGHSYVVIDIFQSTSKQVNYYIDNKEKTFNPYNLIYLGSENQQNVKEQLKTKGYFIAIGNNAIRNKIATSLEVNGIPAAVNAIHPTSLLSPTVLFGHGVMCAPNVTINALAEIGDGVICNTGCIIEHECKIGNFAHIAPGAVLAGNVTIGERSFIGANSVVKQGISIGKDVTVGAGTVVIQDILDNVTVVGNPARIIKQNL